MKSRTSFFNLPAFRKDVTRFAPAWGLYTVGLVMVLMTLMTTSTPYYRAQSVLDTIPIMALVNFIYAFINAQLLFGDLFSSRMCNALHAMPLRRETWFGTHIMAGLAFSIVPNLVVSSVGAVMLNLGAAWPLAPWWLLASTLQYICFFGISALCVMLTGNRFACVVVYGLVNFFSILVYWLVDSLYEPLLYGIRILDEPFYYFSPLVKVMENYDMVDLQYHWLTDTYGNNVQRVITGVILGSGWGILSIYAALGLVFFAVALWLYKKRALECAGDFMAFGCTEPVLLIVYTLTAGGFLYLFSDLFGTGARYIFLFVGLTVGFFTGLMLLQRTTRVFKPKSLLAFVVFMVVFAASLGLTVLDPLGITRWVPDGEDVVSVNLSNRYQRYGYSQYGMDITDPAEIEEIIHAHAYSIGRTEKDEMLEYGHNDTVNCCIEYTLKNGSTRTRFYDVNVDSEAGQLLKKYYSSFRYITGFEESDIPMLAEHFDGIYNYYVRENEELYKELAPTLDAEELLRCIAADCAAGNMAQFGAYHMEWSEEWGWDWKRSTYLELGFDLDEPVTNEDTYIVREGVNQATYLYLNVYEDSTHTLQWMIDHSIYDPEWKY